MGALDWIGRKLTVTTCRTKRSSDFIALLEVLDRLYGPRPGLRTKPVVIVLDNGPIHVSRATPATLAARVHWLTAEWLPKYAPELNDNEAVWRDLKAHHLVHQTFGDAAALNTAIRDAVTALKAERNPDPFGNLRISA
jgi:transposase